MMLSSRVHWSCSRPGPSRRSCAASLQGIAHFLRLIRAGELLAHKGPAGAEAVLEDALEAMAGPDSGVRMGWFKPQAHQPRRRSPVG